MKHLVLCCALLASFAMATAQEKKQRVKFTSVQHIGMYHNGVGLNPELGISAGINCGRFDYMLGATVLTTPIISNAFFTDIRYYITKTQKFYIGSNLGITNMSKKQSLTYINNRVWNTSNWQLWDEGEAIKKLPGIFAQGLIGYKASLGKDVSYNVSLVYGLHQLRYQEDYILPGGSNSTATISYNQWRYGLRAGLSF
jgi:hypothetical protein